MAYTKEMTTSEILLRLASMRNELLQAVNDIDEISKNICYKAEQTESMVEQTIGNKATLSIKNGVVKVETVYTQTESQTQKEDK